MKIKWDDLIAAFAVGVIIGFLLGNSFSSPSSEASPVPYGAGLGFFENYRGVIQWSEIRSHKAKVAGSNPAPANVGLTSRRCFGGFHLEVKETAIIKKAADRNGCYGDDYLILLAIRKAENGGPGKEFGVKGKAWDTDLDTQAGEAAATVVKNRARWNEAGRPPDFISFLGDRYVPKEDDPEGNINFKKNVRFWFERFNR